MQKIYSSRKTSFGLSVIILSLFCASCGSDDIVSGNAPSSSYYDAVDMKIEKQRVNKPYQVKGQWYTPKYQTDYDETGLASWYGDYFHGRPTSNGEKFDMNKISAAHKTLPLPSYVEVTNLDNGKKLYVRVNDRGPFVDDRIIDLSKKAAEILGSKQTGIARVRVRQVSPPRNVVLISPDGRKTIGKGYKNTQPATQFAKKSDTTIQTASVAPTHSGNVPLYDKKYFANNMAPITSPKPIPAIVTAQNIQPPAHHPSNPDAVAAILREHQGSVTYGNAVNNNINNTTNSLVIPNQNAVNYAQNLQQYNVKVGVFASQDNVQKLHNKISGLGRVNIVNNYQNNKTLSTVSLGPYDNLQKAQDTLDALNNLGINGAKVSMQ